MDGTGMEPIIQRELQIIRWSWSRGTTHKSIVHGAETTANRGRVALGGSWDVRLGNSFPWGKEYNHDVLNHGQIESPNFDDSDGFLYTSPVGAFSSGQSVYGLEDTFGNAWEFTADARRATWKFYDKADGDAPRDTMAPGPSLYVGVRGGAYFFDLRPNPGGERNEFLTEVRRKPLDFAVQSPERTRKIHWAENWTLVGGLLMGWCWPKEQPVSSHPIKPPIYCSMHRMHHR